MSNTADLRALIHLIAQALDEPTTRARGRPITTGEVRQARRLRHTGLTWQQVADRMGTTKNRAYTAGRKTLTLKETA